MKNYTFSSSSCAFFLFLSLLLCSSVFAQTSSFTTGTNIISAGLSLERNSISNANNVTNSSRTPEYSLRYERGMWKAGPGMISLGVFLGEEASQYDWLYPPETSPILEKERYWELGLRGAYHFTGLKVANLDTYAGVMISQLWAHYTAGTGPSLYSNSRGLSLFAGARYFMWSHLGVYAELATGPFFNGGIAAKF